MINRGAILLTYREPAIRWINEADPYDEDLTTTKEDLQHDRIVYLVADADADGEAAAKRWVEANFEALFETELALWYTDPELWPEPRTLETFYEWFDVEYHSMVVDTIQGEIRDEEI